MICSFQGYVCEQIHASIALKSSLLNNHQLQEKIVHSAKILSKIFADGGKLLCCGNGGSAADAQHLATEFIIRYRKYPERPSLPAISLVADSSAITAGGNDFGFAEIFSRQIEGLGHERDCLLAFSTSGGSANVLSALATAQRKNMAGIFLTGKLTSENQQKLQALNYQKNFNHIEVNSVDTARIQECHIMIAHILCGLVEKNLFAA